MTTTSSENLKEYGRVDQNGEWRPNFTIKLSPFYEKPFSFEALKWFLHRNIVGFGPYLVTAIVVFYFLQPGPEYFQELKFWPIAAMYLRNAIFMIVVYGGWHLFLYTMKLNGSKSKYDAKWQNVGHKQFLFKNQTYDNIFYSLVPGAGIWTLYEVAYYWCLAHGYLPKILNFNEYPFFFILQLLLIPFWRAFHFYWIHRFLHWKPMYVRFHALHHKNVNIGPWSGMAMHPVEHIGYISCVLIHWIIPSHPIHFFYNMILTTITPASAHTGFEGEVLDGKTSTGDLTHYLHHRYFHYNFGDMNGLPLDKWCGTLHDGSDDFQVKLPYEINENKAYDEINTKDDKQAVKRFDDQGLAYKIWQCTLCAFIYDEALGLPEEGIAPGTRWEDIPEDWVCPDCGLAKSGFDMIEVSVDQETGEVKLNKEKKHIVIVGSGLGGYTIAKEVRKLDPRCSISLFTKDKGRNYSKPMLSNSMSVGKKEKDLVLQSPEQMAESLNLNIRTGVEAVKIDRENKTLYTDGGSVKYDELVLAVGAEQIKPTIHGSGANEISFINHLEHFKRFQEKCDSKKKVLVIGGGLIGCEFANDLKLAGHEVHVVDLEETPLKRQVPEAVGAKVKVALENIGVNWHLKQSVQKIDKDVSGYKIEFASGKTLQVDLVLSAIGLIPNIELAANAGLEVNRGIVVDSYLRTTDENIFAIGDCAEHNKKVLPFVLPITYGSRALAKTLIGQESEVEYPHMPITVKTPSLPICLLPAPDEEKGEWVQEENAVKFINHAGQMKGFVLMGPAVEKKNQFLEQLKSA